VSYCSKDSFGEAKYGGWGITTYYVNLILYAMLKNTPLPLSPKESFGQEGN